MSPSRIFIERPVATALLMAAVMLTGLVAYTQLPVSALPQVDYPTIQVLTFYPAVVPPGLPSELLERRPDIAAGERLMAEANAQIGLAYAAYYPNVTLSAGAGFAASSLVNWLSWPSRFWSIGASAAETIFDGGLRRATVDQSTANYNATVAS